MRIRWLCKALRNLEDEATCIAADDPVAARLVDKRVLDAVAQLPAQPGLGRPGRLPGTREPVVAKTHYLMPYRMQGDVIEVLRVFHTSRRSTDRW